MFLFFRYSCTFFTNALRDLSFVLFSFAGLGDSEIISWAVSSMGERSLITEVSFFSCLSISLATGAGLATGGLTCSSMRARACASGVAKNFQKSFSSVFTRTGMGMAKSLILRRATRIAGSCAPSSKSWACLSRSKASRSLPLRYEVNVSSPAS